MASTTIITRITDENILRERIQLHCEKCGHKFEHYVKLFEQKSSVRCPKCEAIVNEDETVMLD